MFTWRNETGWPVEYVSPNVEQLFGYTPESLCRGDPPYAELVHEDDLDRVIREVKEGSEGSKNRFHHEPYRMVTRSGDVRWVLDYTQILQSDGEITGYMGYVVDITEWKEQVEYVNSLNATIRSLHEALIGANAREGIYQDVCTALTDIDDFAGAWVGAVDFSSDEISPIARAGVDRSYLEAIELLPSGVEPALAVQVAFGDETTSEHRVPDSGSEVPWHSAALSQGYRSVFAVPVSHRGLLHGVLTVYGTRSDTFDQLTQEILTELGTLVGYSITAVERRNALHGDGNRDLVIEVAIDETDPLYTLATRLSGTVEVRSISQRKATETLLHCLISETDHEAVLEAAKEVDGIESIERLSTEGRPIYTVVPVGECAASKTTALGARLQSMRLAESCELVVSVGHDCDQHRFLGQIEALFGRAKLKAERGATPPERIPWATVLSETLTDRQRDVLKAAYHGGYFDENRKRTGKEIAESLGIAQPTFSRHIRAAQRNLLAAIWDCPGEE